VDSLGYAIGIEDFNGFVERFATSDEKRDGFFGDWVTKVEPHRGKQHAVDARSFVEHLVPAMISMAMIPNDRVSDMVQVSSDLMPSSCFRANL
jgi:hypothetical protein